MNICHNKHHILWIIMDETIKFTSGICHEYRPFVCENHVLLWCIHDHLLNQWMLRMKIIQTYKWVMLSLQYVSPF